MHQFTGKVILMLIIVAFFLGAMVVVFDKNYTREKNLRSNRNYYPSVKVEEPVSRGDKSEEETGDQGY